MKKFLFFFVGRPAGRSGVALVLVLAILVLILGLAVALLSLSTNERRSASVFLTSAGVRTLADNAVGIVQAQINQATTRGSTVAWSSQPGMVRTYKAAGDLDTVYKLYSAATMTQTDAAKLSEDLPPTDWGKSPALWTDLNAPVTVKVSNAADQNVYPIVDPGILDLDAGQRPLGFAISNAPGATTAQRAPMPVRWLYVLQDGQIVTASPPSPPATGNTVTLTGATASNPIKGRIAFWTDDESCKVNLNTAGVGSFWNTPHFYTTEDRKFATSQPIKGEFQRYPGHPAMTSLSAVFPGLSDEQILGSTTHTPLTPRYQWGGSKQGTVDTLGTTTGINGDVVAKGPLYADANEVAFLPIHTTQGADPTQRDPDANLNRDLVQRSGFFLTADSRAPEVNLFNLPRIACWPATTPDPDHTASTAFDRVIAFGGSIGNYPYYFQRQSAQDGSVDTGIGRNQQIFTYLQSLTSQTVPGFGASLADKFGIDRDQILTEIWDYIRCTNLYDQRLMTGKQFTSDKDANGYGYVVPLKNGSSRGFGRFITLAELGFVFICTADPVDTQNGATPNAKGMLGSNDPINNLTLGGTALTPTQRRVQMMLVPEFFSPSQGDVAMRARYTRVSISGLDTLQLAGQNLFAAGSGSVRFSDVNFNTGWHRRFLGGLFDYRALLRGVADGGRLDAAATPAYPFISQFVTVPVTNPATAANPASAANPGTMAFKGGQLTVTIETSTDNASWVTAQTIPIKSTLGTTNIPVPNLVRTGTGVETVSATPATNAQNWWAFSRKAPAVGAVTAVGGRLANLSTNTGYYKVFAGVATNGGRLAGTLFRESEDNNYYTDVVRSVAPSHGDLRLVGGLANVPDNAFTPVGNWSLTGAANALMHTLGTGVQTSITVPEGSQYRRHYVAAGLVGGDVTMGPSGYSPPAFRTDAPAAALAVQASGDFDNGTAYWPDGAYINKPDEGNVYTSASSVPYFDSSEQETVNSGGFFSPNRVMPGPGMFGSLPTHLKRYAADPAHGELYAWRTLLFRHQPGHPNDVAMTTGGLSGTGQAPDHLLMDLFWMPTVEPYAISEPFSTAGKVNMNYQLQPFPYIQRATGMYAVLQREKLLAVSAGTDLGRYKASSDSAHPQSGAAAVGSYSHGLDVADTLKQFDKRFGDPSGRIFLSPTELCDLWLVPQDLSPVAEGTLETAMKTFWATNNLTGDNMREKPYTNIIPRLTTKSNTYTVHYRVQSLKSPRNTDPGTWDESKGIIAGEFRGSTTIQRFINLNDPTLLGTDFASATAGSGAATLDSFTRWRILNARQFAP